jgi:hypothetical protein
MSFGGRVVAQQITLTSASVIGGSGTQDSATFNNGQYGASQVTDEQTGGISIEDNSSTPLTTYWLGPDTTNSAYFVVDLGASYTLAQISLFNTHNSFYADRGTNAFHIDASNSVFSAGTAGFDLVSATTILSGNLAFANPATEIFYTSGNGLSSGGNAYQYLRFTADTYYSQGSGLNEIRVFAAIPEPSTCAALAGLLVGSIALFAKRHQRAA